MPPTCLARSPRQTATQEPRIVTISTSSADAMTSLGCRKTERRTRAASGLDLAGFGVDLTGAPVTRGSEGGGQQAAQCPLQVTACHGLSHELAGSRFERSLDHARCLVGRQQDDREARDLRSRVSPQAPEEREA